MADTPDLGSGAVRRGGSSPPSRSNPLITRHITLILCIAALTTVALGCSDNSLTPIHQLPHDYLDQAIALENEAQEGFFLGKRSLVNDLYADILHKSELASPSQSFHIGNYWYQAIRPHGLREFIFVRYPRQPTAAINSALAYSTILDINQVRDKIPTGEIGVLRPSHDGSLTAFSLAESAGDSFRLFTIEPNKTLESAQYVPLPEEHLSVIDVQWGRNAQELFVTLGHNHRAFTLVTVRLNSAASEVIRLSDCPNEAQHLRLKRAESGAFLVADCESASQSSIRMVSLLGNPPTMKIIKGLQSNARYTIHQSGKHLIAAEFGDSSAPRLFTIKGDLSSDMILGREIELPKDFILDEIRSVASAFVLRGRRGLTGSVFIMNSASTALTAVTLPYNNSSVRFLADDAYQMQEVRIAVESYHAPGTVWILNVQTGEIRLDYGSHAKEFPVVMRVIMASGSDNVPIPMTVLHARNDTLSSPRPTVLYGYGAYGSALTPQFMPEVIVLMDRGFRVAFAHVRGGGELGPAWHQAAIGARKTTSFEDLLVCARHLIESGIARRQALFGFGRSAGGLLMARAATIDPELFGGLILEVPYLSVWKTMTDPNSPFRVREFSEWGSPADAEVRHTVQRYDPLINPPQGAFPYTYIYASAKDEVIPITDVLEWSRLVRNASQYNRVLLRIARFDSHRGAETSQDALREKAHQLAFMLNSANVPK